MCPTHALGDHKPRPEEVTTLKGSRCVNIKLETDGRCHIVFP